LAEINQKVKRKKMKNKLMTTIAGTFLALFMICGAAQVNVYGQNDSDQKKSENSEKSIVGVWETSVTIRNCETGAPLSPVFLGLSTYNSGGTYTESSGGGNPILRSAGHGVWERESGWRNYSLKFTFLRFSPTGVLIGKQRVYQTLELSEDGDQLTSSGRFEVLDLNGNVLATGCSTAAATRFE
jgi:hypothetical protein